MASIVFSEHTLLPAGSYLVRVRQVEDVVGRFGCQLQWVFDVVRPLEHEGRTLTAWTKRTGSLASKTADFVRALGLRVGPKASLEYEDLVGHEALATVITKDVHSEAGDRTVNRIERLRPHVKAKASHSLPAAGDEDGDPFDD